MKIELTEELKLKIFDLKKQGISNKKIAKEIGYSTCFVHHVLNPEKSKQYSNNYYQLNKNKIAKRNAKRYQKDKKIHSERRKKYYKKNKEKILKRHELRRINKREELRAYTKTDKYRKRARERRALRVKSDINYKLRCHFSSRILDAIKKNYKFGRKHSKTLDLLGCSIQFVKKHLESLWLPGMNWENHALHGWHIDHIKPCASFDLTDPEQQKICFHYTNLQPLWAIDNIKKGKKTIL